jgi:long-chain acyl-CoA synthetase
MSKTRTLVERLVELGDRFATAPAFHERDAAGAWTTRSWGEVCADARGIAGGLAALGLERGETVALVGDDRADWVTLQLGVQLAGGVPSPIYTTLTTEQTGYVIAHSGARIAAADTAERVERVREGARGAGGRVGAVIAFAEAAADPPDGALPLDALRAEGRSRAAEVERRLAAHRADDLALLIYTSGTTGRPKGVELQYAAIAAVIDEVETLIEPALGGEPYRVVSYLPLSHIAEQMMSAVAPLAFGGQVFFCPRLEQVREVLPEVRPTVFLGVPRIWEKVERALEDRIAAAGGARGRLARWALATELAAFEREHATGGRRKSFARSLADRLVTAKIRRALGLDRVRVAISGAAPIGLGTLRFFASLGLPIHEVFGMTETAAVATFNRPGHARLGTVGPCLECGELRLEADGEILYRGPNVTRGYRSDSQATAELIDAEGWLHTGDLGALDADGFLRVTGRKKEILVTAGGKKIAPAEVEPLFAAIRGVSQAVLVGDGRPFLCALVTLEPQAAAAVAAELGLAAREPAELANDSRFQSWLEGEVETHVNAHLAKYQTVKRVAVLERELTVAEGEVTPTMKLRRGVIAARHADRIAALYEEPGAASSEA